MNVNEVLQRWILYTDELFKSDAREFLEITKEVYGSSIGERTAMQTVKLGNSPSDDKVLIEILEAGGEMVDKITRVAKMKGLRHRNQSLYQCQRKQGQLNAGRTEHSLMSHITNIIGKVIFSRIKPEVERDI